MPPEGIEPPSQEPESYVISITLRGRRMTTILVYLIIQEKTS